MPTLEIFDKNGQIISEASNYILSIMMFPIDENARISWRKNIFYGQLIKLAAENLDFHDVEPFEKEIIQNIKTHGMEGWAANETWVKRSELVWRNGAYSGAILYHIVNMHKLGMDTSINKALWIIAKSLDESSRNDNFLQKIGPLKKCWSEFRSVASLWTSAWRCDLSYSEDLSYSLYNQLTDFLSMAKWHENEITSIVPRGAHKPILEKEAMWQVPNNQSLKTVEFTTNGEVIDYYQEILADYSAELVVNSYSGRTNKKFNK